MEPAHTQAFRGKSRRGLTLIETICAVAMLALVAAAVLGAFNSIMSAQERQRHRLGAMELANRLILQYLDDNDTMPAAGLPIVYSDERYHWELNVIPVRLVPARPDTDNGSSSSAVSVDRMKAISVTVWLSEESGGSMDFDPRIPSATLTRLMDPIALRNPDTTKYLAQSGTKQRELIEAFRSIARNATVKPPNTPTTPATPAKPATPAPAAAGKAGATSQPGSVPMTSVTQSGGTTIAAPPYNPFQSPALGAKPVKPTGPTKGGS